MKNGKLRDSCTMWAILPPKTSSLTSALGMFDNKDAGGLRLYGYCESTLFRMKRHAREQAEIWPGAKVVPVFIRARGV